MSDAALSTRPVSFHDVLCFEATVSAAHPNAASRWGSGSAGLPYVEFTGEFDEFHGALGRGGWLEPFDWPAWVPEAERFVREPWLIAGADVGTLRRLLTTHFRRDRFVEGHRLAMVENGHMAAILRRLRALSRTREEGR